jgi:hypothetical protein
MRKAFVVLVSILVLCALFTASALHWGPWWQLHYGVVGMSYRYLDKDTVVQAAFVAQSIQHLHDQGMIRCDPPAQFGDGRVGTPTAKGELEAECYWFQSSTFPGYFRLDSWGEPLYACSLDAIGRTPRPPLGASSTMTTLTNPPELNEWDRWAADHGARTADEVGQR